MEGAEAEFGEPPSHLHNDNDSPSTVGSYVDATDHTMDGKGKASACGPLVSGEQDGELSEDDEINEIASHLTGWECDVE